MDFAGIKSLDDLLKTAGVGQVSEPYGEQGESNATSVSEPLTKPVSSIKLPGAYKKTIHKYPQDILDEYKIQTQDSPTSNTNPNL